MSTADPDYVAQRNAALIAENGSPQQDAAVEAAHEIYLGLGRGGTTPAGLPYPSPLDPIFEVADAIRALAEAIAIQSGKWTGNLTAGASNSGLFWSGPQTINFPTPFDAPPAVIITHNVRGTVAQWAILGSVSPTSFTFRAASMGSAPGSSELSWIAIAPRVSAAAGDPTFDAPDASDSASEVAS